MPYDWPFADPPNRIAYSVRVIVNGEMQALRAYHDVGGEWQFLRWETPAEDDIMIVALHVLVDQDPTLMSLADLPEGWHALRRTSAEEWQRSITPAEEEE